MTEVPAHRFGHPSPLIFHLGAAVAGYQAAIATANKIEGSSIWRPELVDDVKSLGELDQLKLCESSLNRMQGFLSGLEKWQTHPYRRIVPEPDVIWSNGSSRLLDYGTCTEAVNPDGIPVLVIPSLINRSYILDLNENRSLLRFMASQGLRPLLLDWGIPTDVERSFDLDDYVIQRFLPAIELCQSLSDKPFGILGYCMGGTLAAGVLSIFGNRIGAFATIGSPWNFSAAEGITAALQKMAIEQNAPEIIDGLGKTFGMIPVDFFQQLFALINPIQAAVKFRKFNEMDQASKQAAHFVAIEDWLADGIPLPAPTAQDTLVGWNLNNDTYNGHWELTGEVVDLKTIKQPTMNICGLRDSITQPVVATAISSNISKSTLLTPNAGHVGMIVGSKAPELVWKPVSKFFNETLNNHTF